MSTLSFKDWLLQVEMAPAPGAVQNPNVAPDPTVAMAQAAVKTAMAKPDPTKPLATQARNALSQAAAKAPNPMKIAQLDQGDAAAAGPGGQPKPGAVQ